MNFENQIWIYKKKIDKMKYISLYEDFSFDTESEVPYIKRISNVEFEDIDHNDHPDYVDAFITYAELDGKPMTEEQLDELNDDKGLVYDLLMDHLF